MLMQYPVTCEYNSWHEHIPISTEDLYSFLSLHLVYFNCIFFATEDASMCICLHGNNECPRFCYVYRNRGNKWHQGLLFITEDLPLIYAYQCFFFWCFVFVFTAARDSCTTLVNALVNSTSKYWWSVFVYFPDPMNL